MKLKIAWICLLSVVAVCGWSCKKNSPTSQRIERFDPAVQGLAVKPMLQIDAQTAAFITKNKKALIAGEEVIPPIGQEDTAVIPAEAPMPVAATPTAMPGETPAPAVGTPATAAPARSVDPFSSDPNSGNKLPW